MLSSWCGVWRGVGVYWHYLVACCGVCFLLGFALLYRPGAEQFFCALRASGLSSLFMRAPLHVVVVLLCVVVGASSVLEFFSVFFSILRLFLQHRSPQFFVAFLEPFSVFRWKFGGRLLSPYVVARFSRVLARFVRGFKLFSVCPLRVLRSTAFWRTCSQLLPRRPLHLLGIQWALRPWLREPRILFLTRLRSTWYKRSNSPYHPSLLRFAQRISPPRFPVRPFPLFPALYPALFPVLFPARPWLLPARFPPLQVR